MSEHRIQVEQRADGKWVAVDYLLHRRPGSDLEPFWSPFSETRGYRTEAAAERKAARRLRFWTDLELHRTAVLTRPPISDLS